MPNKCEADNRRQLDIASERLLATAQTMRGALIAQARRYVGCRFLAEDVLHDVLLRILATEAPADINSAEGYLTRLVRNLAIDRARRLGFESRIFKGNTEDHLSMAADGFCPAAAFQGRQALRIVEGALRELPERINAAFRMHRIDGMAQKDVAEAMGVSRALVCEFVRRGHEHCLEALAANHGGCPLPLGAATAQNVISVCAADSGERLGKLGENPVDRPKRWKNGEQGHKRLTLRGGAGVDAASQSGDRQAHRLDERDRRHRRRSKAGDKDLMHDHP